MHAYWERGYNIPMHDGTRGHTDCGRVIGCTKDQLWGAVVSRADVRHVWFAGNQHFCAAKITQLEDASSGVEQQVLRLDVSVADAKVVDICKGAEQLVCVEFNVEHWEWLLLLCVLPCHLVTAEYEACTVTAADAMSTFCIAVQSSLFSSTDWPPRGQERAREAAYGADRTSQ